MATFRFTSPDGKKYRITGPDGATQEEAFGILQGQIDDGTAAEDTQLRGDPAQLAKRVQDGSVDPATIKPETMRRMGEGTPEGLENAMYGTDKFVRNAVPFHLYETARDKGIIPGAVAGGDALGQASALLGGAQPGANYLTPQTQTTAQQLGLLNNETAPQNAASDPVQDFYKGSQNFADANPLLNNTLGVAGGIGGGVALGGALNSVAKSAQAPAFVQKAAQLLNPEFTTKVATEVPGISTISGSEILKSLGKFGLSGAVNTGIDDSVDQLNRKGEIDPSELGINTATGSVLAPGFGAVGAALPGTLKAGSRIGKIFKTADTTDDLLSQLRAQFKSSADINAADAAEHATAAQAKQLYESANSQPRTALDPDTATSLQNQTAVGGAKTTQAFDKALNDYSEFGHTILTQDKFNQINDAATARTAAQTTIQNADSETQRVYAQMQAELQKAAGTHLDPNDAETLKELYQIKDPENGYDAALIKRLAQKLGYTTKDGLVNPAELYNNADSEIAKINARQNQFEKATKTITKQYQKKLAPLDDQSKKALEVGFNAEKQILSTGGRLGYGQTADDVLANMPESVYHQELPPQVLQRAKGNASGAESAAVKEGATARSEHESLPVGTLKSIRNSTFPDFAPADAAHAESQNLINDIGTKTFDADVNNGGGTPRPIENSLDYWDALLNRSKQSGEAVSPNQLNEKYATNLARTVDPMIPQSSLGDTLENTHGVRLNRQGVANEIGLNPVGTNVTNPGLNIAATQQGVDTDQAGTLLRNAQQALNALRQQTQPLSRTSLPDSPVFASGLAGIQYKLAIALQAITGHVDTRRLEEALADPQKAKALMHIYEQSQANRATRAPAFSAIANQQSDNAAHLMNLSGADRGRVSIQLNSKAPGARDLEKRINQ